MEVSDYIAIAALVIAIMGTGVAAWYARRAEQRSAEANSIAKRVGALAEARYREERRVFVQPDRYDSKGGAAVIFRVVCALPVDEVEFEFRHYSEEGGLCRRQMVTAGEERLSLVDFDEGSDLDTPPSATFFARARWRTGSSDDWEKSGTYSATKQRRSFTPIDAG